MTQSPPAAVPEDLDAATLLRPVISPDTKYFWDGVRAHELRIQRLPDGGLNHPPRPALWMEPGGDTDYEVAAGTGRLFSFVHHAPKVPGRISPFVVGPVELDEGVRMLGEVRDIDVADVEIGMPVQAGYIDFPERDDRPAWTNYFWTGVIARALTTRNDPA